MSINGLVWFLTGGFFGCLLGGIVAYNVAFERDYADSIDFYDLDPIEIETPSYDQMEEYDAYEFEEF